MLRCMKQELEVHRLGPMLINLDLLPSLILTGILRLFSIQLEVATSLYSLLFAKFKMRFIPFIIASAMLRVFNTHAYAKPVRLESHNSGIGHLASWCDGYDDDTCHKHCVFEGYSKSQCTTKYVQMPSYKFDLSLTCKLQFL